MKNKITILTIPGAIIVLLTTLIVLLIFFRKTVKQIADKSKEGNEKLKKLADNSWPFIVVISILVWLKLLLLILPIK